MLAVTVVWLRLCARVLVKSLVHIRKKEKLNWLKTTRKKGTVFFTFKKMYVFAIAMVDDMMVGYLEKEKRFGVQFNSQQCNVVDVGMWYIQQM